MKRKGINRLVAILLILLLLPMHGVLEEGASASFVWLQRTYETGKSLFQLDNPESYDRARNVFEEAGNYQDSKKYVRYIDAAMALEAEDYESAAIIFQVLGDVSFLDAARQYEYTQARRAEQDGQTKSAMVLYARSEVRDAPARLDALHSAHPEIDITKADLPQGAREGGYAYVMKDRLPAMNEPGGAKKLFEFPLFDAVETLTFAHDAAGSAWAAVPVEIEEVEKTETGYLQVNSLHIMNEAEEAEYQEALLAAPPPPEDHYGQIVTGGVNIRPEASMKSGSHGEVKRKDIVELLGDVTGADGEPWFNILTKDGTEGYLQSRHILELTDEEDSEHRVLIGRVPDPTPKTTPMPVPAPTALPEGRIVLTPTGYRVIPILWDHMTNEEKYDMALFILASGNPDWIGDAIRLLRELNGYKNAAAYLEYLEIVWMAEQGDFDGAEARLSEAFRSGSFGWYMGGAPEIEIPDGSDMYRYIQGRRAEANGQGYLAIGWYDRLDMWDAIDRMVESGVQYPAPSVVDTVHGVTPEDRIQEPIFTDDLNESDEICTRSECEYLPAHAAWLCGHCRFSQTELCMQQCTECEGYLCAEEGFAHEKICDVCGAFDCTDTRGGAENHGWGKCRQSKPKATEAPVVTQGTGQIFSPFLDKMYPPKSTVCTSDNKCPCTACVHKYGYCPCE